MAATIAELHVQNFRNIEQFQQDALAQYNIFFGNNGSGKTSLLEAVAYLSTGKSFRGSHATQIIKNGEDFFSIYALVDKFGAKVPLGLQRRQDNSKQIKIDGENVGSTAKLAQELPIIFIDTHSYRYFHDGPKVRRNFMNFGLFHVKHEFYEAWRKFHSVLKQRNACLKQNVALAEVAIWNQQYIEYAEALDRMRREYVSLFIPIYMDLVKKVLPDYPNFEIQYMRGWDSVKNMSDILQNNLFNDRRCGFTQFGPHKADLKVLCNGTSVEDVLSQGQQKLASYILYLAQGILMRQLSDKSPIYLIDDLPSELDSEKNQLMIDVIKSLDSQVFVSGIHEKDLQQWCRDSNFLMFHVKHGVCCQIHQADVVV